MSGMIGNAGVLNGGRREPRIWGKMDLGSARDCGPQRRGKEWTGGMASRARGVSGELVDNVIGWTLNVPGECIHCTGLQFED